MKVLVTGASGFVGRALCARLNASGIGVRAAVRERARTTLEDAVEIGDIGTHTNWAAALSGCDAVVHLAAKVHDAHVADESGARRCFAVNTDATERLARAALTAGVRRFVFLSTIKVLGESSGVRPLDESDVPRPRGPYAESKWQAERALAAVARSGPLEVVVLRPPLLYGPGVRANFLRLMQWIDRRRLLPFGSVRNRRSVLSVGNLASAIVACVQHPAAGGETFLVDDGEPVSTPALIRALAASLGRAPRLVPCPVSLLRTAAVGFGYPELFERLCGNLEVSSGKLRVMLDWVPPETREIGLRATAAWFRTQRQAAHG